MIGENCRLVIECCLHSCISSFNFFFISLHSYFFSGCWFGSILSCLCTCFRSSGTASQAGGSLPWWVGMVGLRRRLWKVYLEVEPHLSSMTLKIKASIFPSFPEFLKLLKNFRCFHGRKLGFQPEITAADFNGT